MNVQINHKLKLPKPPPSWGFLHTAFVHCVRSLTGYRIKLDHLFPTQESRDKSEGVKVCLLRQTSS